TGFVQCFSRSSPKLAPAHLPWSRIGGRLMILGFFALPTCLVPPEPKFLTGKINQRPLSDELVDSEKALDPAGVALPGFDDPRSEISNAQMDIFPFASADFQTFDCHHVRMMRPNCAHSDSLKAYFLCSTRAGHFPLYGLKGQPFCHGFIQEA